MRAGLLGNGERRGGRGRGRCREQVRRELAGREGPRGPCRAAQVLGTQHRRLYLGRSRKGPKAGTVSGRGDAARHWEGAEPKGTAGGAPESVGTRRHYPLGAGSFRRTDREPTGHPG